MKDWKFTAGKAKAFPNLINSNSYKSKAFQSKAQKLISARLNTIHE